MGRDGECGNVGKRRKSDQVHGDELGELWPRQSLLVSRVYPG